MKKVSFCLILIFLAYILNLYSEEGSYNCKGWDHQHIPSSIWKDVRPYLLPYDHPIREKLDAIFTKSRATLSVSSMRKAGFQSPKPRKYTRIIVTKHPELKGFIIKTYLDAQRLHHNKPDHYFYLLRIKGAKIIQRTIDENGWNGIFKVPKKWIYPLPKDPAPPKEFDRKNFILVQEDMNLLPDKENYAMWNSSAVTASLLDMVYYICETFGFEDCAKPDNIPFSRDGKIAFIDTQTFDTWPVRYEKLDGYLSPEMKQYWKKITKK